MKIKTFFKTFVKIIGNLIKDIFKQMDLIIKFIMAVLAPIMFCSKGYITEAIICIVSYIFGYLGLKVLNNYKLSCNGFPICKKRFTKKSEINDKVICVKNEDMIQAIRYLYDVENYAERNGLK